MWWGLSGWTWNTWFTGENKKAYNYLAVLVDILRTQGRDSARYEDLEVGLHMPDTEISEGIII